MTPLPQTWFVFRFNHFDPLWRRCWDRPFHDDGRRFASYREIETAWLDDVLTTARDGESCFMVEASWVLRNYLEQHPAHAATLRTLAQAGRFELLGSGENIIDGNLVHGETLTRNLILGTLWGEQALGVRPTVGWHADGFGSSAQMPQIFRQCGYEWIAAISYCRPDAPFWRGLDGSAILNTLPGRYEEWNVLGSQSFRKHPPCEFCRGEGCPKCDGRGFRVTWRAELTVPSAPVAAQVGVAMLWGEEVLPGLHVAGDIARLNVTQRQFVFRQGTYSDLKAYLQPELALVDNPPAGLISSRMEHNPTMSGCWVTRIRCKQEHRIAEHLLLAAESWDALLNGGSQADRLRAQWRALSLSAFQDSITSSHVDPAYDELLDLLAGVQREARDAAARACATVVQPIDRAVTLFNHQGFPATAPVTVTVPGTWTGAAAHTDGQAIPVYGVVPEGASTRITFGSPAVPGLGARTVYLTEGPARRETLDARTVTCGRYTVEAGERGLTRIDVEGLGTVATEANFLFGELVLEADYGDPWNTRSLDRTRERLSPHTKLAALTREDDSIVVRYTGAYPANVSPFKFDAACTYMAWSQEFHLRAGIPWLEVITNVDWYTQDRRLRLAFPSVTTEDRGVYEIPHGVLERDRYEPSSADFPNGNGDWPVIHWAGIQTPDYTFAIFNLGTPSYRIEDGAVTVSVLRSPTYPCCLLEPASYVAHNYFGMMDHGTHTFRHALYIGAGDWRTNDVARQAALFNSGLTTVPGALTAPLPALSVEAAHTLLTAVKPAEAGTGIVLRLVESAGSADTVRVRVPQGVTAAWVTNLLEDVLQPLPIEEGAVQIALAPWKIATIKLL